MILSCTGLVQGMNNDKKQLIQESINKKDDRGCSTMIFHYAPKENQINYEAYTDKETLETITTYSDPNGKVHYTIEYHNPFDSRILYNKTGFIIPHEISKDLYDQKKKEIDKNWNNWDGKQCKTAALIHIKDSYPNVLYIEHRSSYVKNDDTYTYAAIDFERIAYPLIWVIRFGKSTADKAKIKFNSMAQEYEKQPTILYKKLLQEQDCAAFKNNNLIEYDCCIKYEETETKDIDSCKEWVKNKERAKQEQNKRELEKQERYKREKELEKSFF